MMIKNYYLYLNKPEGIKNFNINILNKLIILINFVNYVKFINFSLIYITN
jgi:hypothetical protein